MRVLYVTDSDYSFHLMKDYLKKYDIELISPKQLDFKVYIDQTNQNEEDSSIAIARAYHETTHLPTIVDISGLYIDRFKESEQPGVSINKINEEDFKEKEVLIDNFINMLILRGGRSLAHYVKGVCFIDEDGNISSDTFEEKEFLLTSKKSEKVRFNAGLECISFDLDAQKYFNERNKEEEEVFYSDLFAKLEKMLHNNALTNARGE